MGVTRRAYTNSASFYTSIYNIESYFKFFRFNRFNVNVFKFWIKWVYFCGRYHKDSWEYIRSIFKIVTFNSIKVTCGRVDGEYHTSFSLKEILIIVDDIPEGLVRYKLSSKLNWDWTIYYHIPIMKSAWNDLKLLWPKRMSRLQSFLRSVPNLTIANDIPHGLSYFQIFLMQNIQALQIDTADRKSNKFWVKSLN